MKRSIISLSGGMDSATVLAIASSTVQRQASECLAVSFRYGSKHNPYELEAAIRLAAWYRVEHRIIDLVPVMNSLDSNLMSYGGPIPEGHYEAESMKLTVVPGRNLIFASILAAIAQSEGQDQASVWLGVHAGDHAIYPDCRPEFISALQAVIDASVGSTAILVITPFLMDTKKEILHEGIKMGVPYHLTRTCYKDQPVACGKCGSCQERLAGFAALGRDDPIEYESRTILSV